VVVTNGLLIAAALADAPGVTVLLTGGMLRQAALSVVGDLAAQVLHSTRIDKGFFGARGLSLERGLMDLNPDEVRIKQQMVAACEHVIGLFDASKWRRSALLSFVPAERVDAIVTDAEAPTELVESWRARGVAVHQAAPAPAAASFERVPDLLRSREESLAG
jgi:DeoR/GlpR family transcriptional regulator of sugar metabolism